MPNKRISMSKLKQLIGLQSSNLSVRALCGCHQIMSTISSNNGLISAAKTARK